MIEFVGPTPIDRVLARMSIGDEEHWVFPGGDNGNGYRSIGVAGRPARLYVHRLIYAAVRGPIPDGMEIDHLCRVRACVRPSHLEAVTRAENIARQRRPVCRRGHPRTPANTWTSPDGLDRRCRICDAAREAERVR